MALTWGEVMRQDAATVGAVEARWLVEEASGLTTSELASRPEEPVTARSLAYHDRMLERRVSGEPLQYVLGRWGFRGLDLFVDRRVLIPRPETEVVVDVALEELDRQGGTSHTCRVLDLGTGSGAIALSIATERPRTLVWATDVSPAALEVARANLAGIGRSGSRVTVLEGTWFEALPERSERFELIVSNPPYVGEAEVLAAEVEGWEPVEALRSGPEGLDSILTILGGAKERMAGGGALVLEIAPTQAGVVRAAARDLGYRDVDVHPDLSGRPRCLRARS